MDAEQYRRRSLQCFGNKICLYCFALASDEKLSHYFIRHFKSFGLVLGLSIISVLSRYSQNYSLFTTYA